MDRLPQGLDARAKKGRLVEGRGEPDRGSVPQGVRPLILQSRTMIENAISDHDVCISLASAGWD